MSHYDGPCKPIDELRALIESGLVVIGPGNIAVSKEEAEEFFACADPIGAAIVPQAQNEVGQGRSEGGHDRP